MSFTLIGKNNMQPANVNMPKGRRVIWHIAVIYCASLLGACSSWGVKPWERDLLAKKAMLLTNDATDLASDDHIYFSKEGTSGGRGFAGGGCGCN